MATTCSPIAGSTSSGRLVIWRAPYVLDWVSCWAGLAARLRQAAVDLRVGAHVVEWAGEDRERDGPALCAGLRLGLEVVTLPGGEHADREPDDDQHRRDLEHDRHVPRFRKSERRSSAGSRRT